MLTSVSLQGIASSGNGIPTLASAGEAVINLGKIEFPEDVKEPKSFADAKPSNKKLGPIPTINNGRATFLRISITEQGDIGVDIDNRIAFIASLYEALGPVVVAGLRTRLESAFD